MFIQLVTQHPEALGAVLTKTPLWVGGLFAALLALGLSQARERQVSQLRMAVMPFAMTGLSLWGSVSAFGKSPLFAYVLLVWAAGALLVGGLVAMSSAPAGTHHDAASCSFRIPGSWLPLALILGIFLTKYVVGVDLAMQPGLAHDGQYTLVVGALYGIFSGAFTGRSVRLWRMALRRVSSTTSSPLVNT
ncbi:MAG: hypothetical protein Q8L91_13525 [Polaromonas sp.]|nr:hypothetical protein [Polaromonas sp.]